MLFKIIFITIFIPSIINLLLSLSLFEKEKPNIVHESKFLYLYLPSFGSIFLCLGAYYNLKSFFHNGCIEKDELIFSGRTDENGKITIPEIRYGKYYILEKEAPEGYTLNPERMYFEILEDGKVVKATMTDEKVVVEVPSTGITDTHIIEIAGALLTLGGIGVIVYVKKKKQK